jgi:hypothetical protein
MPATTKKTIRSRMFPLLPAVPSGLRSILLSPDLQMQDLVDQANNQEPIPMEPITQVRLQARIRHVS